MDKAKTPAKSKVIGYILKTERFDTSELDDWDGNYAILVLNTVKRSGWYIGDEGSSGDTEYFCKDLDILQTASEALFKCCPVCIETEFLEYPFDHLLCTSIKLENKEEFI